MIVMMLPLLGHGEFTMKVSSSLMRRVAGRDCEFIAREMALFINERTGRATKYGPRKAPCMVTQRNPKTTIYARETLR